MASNEMNILQDEILAIEEEMKKNILIKINLIKSNKLKKLFIKINEFVELKFILQYEYPKVSPNLMQILYSKQVGLDNESEESLESFFKQVNLSLNEIIDRCHGKCCVYKIYKELENILARNGDMMEKLNEIETFSLSDGKDDLLDSLINKKIQEKKNQNSKEKDKKQNSSIDTEEKDSTFKGSDLIFKRLKWDESFDTNDVIIGYTDRFKGIMEMKFNDFKGVHEHYKDGIPLHRIQYYKICGKIVWDRKNKIDLLTGADLKDFVDSKNKKSKKTVHDIKLDNTISDAPILKYNELHSTWEEEKPSEASTSFNNQLNILTYNVLATSNFKHSIRYAYEHGASGLNNIISLNRNDKIIECLVSSNADLIALQECDVETEKEIKNHKIIREKYCICSTNHLNDDVNCLILTKFTPSSFKLLKLIENSTKYALIIRFNACLTSLKQVTEVSFANIHLTSDKSTNATAKRRKQLESLTNYLNERSLNSVSFICGDFNTGNEMFEDEQTIKKYLIENNFVDMAPHADTFDPRVNFTAAITSSSNKPRRYDRIYMKNESKTTQYSIKSGSLLNTKPLEFEKPNQFYYEPYASITTYSKEDKIYLNESSVSNFSDVDKSKLYLQPSDHYALQILIAFKNIVDVSNLSHKAALALVLPKHSASIVQDIRKKYDKTFNRWPPHINLLYPFYEQMNVGKISQNLSQVLSKFEPFQTNLDHLNSFEKNCVVYLEQTNKDEEKIVCKIQDELKNYFSDLADNEKSKSFTPHMTIAQPEQRRDAGKKWAETMVGKITSEFGQADSFQAKLPIDAVYWLTRANENDPFIVKRAFPIGKYLPPIHMGLEVSLKNSNCGFIGFLQNKNLISSGNNNALNESSNLLISTLTSILKNFKSNEYDNINTPEAYVIGSYCFGTKYNDIDMIVLKQKVNSELSGNNEKETHDNFIKELAKSIAFHQDDFYIARVISDAYVPIIEITLNENSKNYKTLIENDINMIDMQIYEIPNDDRFILSNNHFGNSIDYMKEISNDYTSISRLSAIFENENLKYFIKYYKDFQVLISFVKYWAESRSIYGKAFGYIGGVSYAIICIYFLQQTENEFEHILGIDNSNSRFFNIILKFFNFYSTFKWHENCISLVELDKVENETKDFSEFRQRTAITVLQSVYPYENLTRNIKENGKKSIKDEFKRASKIIEEWKTKHKEDLYLNDEIIFGLCEAICKKYELKEHDYKAYIKFQVHYNKNNNIHHIFSIMKSKTQGFVGNLERILDKNHVIRVLPELEHIDKEDNKNTFSKLVEYTIGIKYDIGNFIDDEIDILCKKFCTNVSSLCYTSEFEITFTKQLLSN